ncbi:MAG: 2Fe-2S iron-sulfur cluster-binding protein [Rhodanobacteraceae bacterium]
MCGAHARAVGSRAVCDETCDATSATIAAFGVGQKRVPYTVTLQASGKHFTVAPGETVLEAARRTGLALPYSCLAGVCGSCKATLIEGTCAYPRNPPSALNAAERTRHQVLLCQAVPKSDLVIAAREVASVADIPRRVLTLTLVEKCVLSDDVVRLVLLGNANDRLRRLPGQYLDVLLPDGRRRAFSIANAPDLRANVGADPIELHVRHVAGGGFTSFVFDELEPGTLLRVEGPLGTFVPREDSERPLLLMAGGTGFAPIKALIEHFLELGSRRSMRLYWGARAASELYLRELPERWVRETTLRFEPVISDPEHADGLRIGLVHEALLEDQPDLSAFDVYMSGPPTMIDAGRRAFVQAGLPEERLYYDSFDYAPEVLARILRGRAGIHGL